MSYKKILLNLLTFGGLILVAVYGGLSALIYLFVGMIVGTMVLLHLLLNTNMLTGFCYEIHRKVEVENERKSTQDKGSI